MVDRSSPTAATTGPAAGRLSKVASPPYLLLATGQCSCCSYRYRHRGLHGLSEHERYFFETKGYLVVPDMLTPAQVDRMNEAIDQSPQQAEGLETFTTKRAICYREHDVVRARAGGPVLQPSLDRPQDCWLGCDLVSTRHTAEVCESGRVGE